MSFTTKFSATLCLTLVLAAGRRALAVNDWSVPCTQGKCSWDLPADSSASGALHIWGPTSAISDITPAAGWQITTNCDPSATTQKIQLVCQDSNPDCDHLFQGGGAVDTIVRVPDGCGPIPFARVAQHQILQSNLSSRASEAPVHELALDTNFTAATPSQDGNVHFSIQGMNSNIGSPARRGHQRRVRSLTSSRDKIYRRHFLASGVNAPRGLGSFNHTLAANPIPIDFSGVTNLFNTSIECPASAAIPISSSASVSLDVGADVHVTVGLGAVAAGSLIPPSITEFGLTIALDGNVDANLSVVANISGQVSSPSITLFQIGIPGLSFPGILEVGPEFKLMSQFDAKFGLNNINAAVDLNYNLSGVSFVFPPQAGSNVDGITPGSKQVTISTSPDVGATFEATGHLIPQVDIGLSALGGIASTTVFLNLDASADFTVSTTSIASPQPCVNASSDLNVGVGAQGSFFDLFNASVGTSLFDKEFPLFQKCFGPANPSSTAPPATVTLSSLRRRHDSPRARHLALFGGSLRPLHAKRLDLSCP
ncbi:hypothetical protein DFH94DRAFT_655780 [Russula ochroleuca]|uniref:DUF7223 domain-containing protein n=1 Tax=Russula ochroleuca TaxID=152965 RepID=A0A9P5JZA6_9AGAM|nr:hypothetical protein DFH94DRAFT_655780 [Russula ochroleuca]